MNKTVSILLITTWVGAVGCGGKDGDSASELKKAFPSSSSANPDSQQAGFLGLVNAAVEAERKHEYAEAAGSLMALRTQKELTVEQRSAVQDAMGRLQTSLALRADRGDSEAIAALKAIRSMKSR